MLLVTWVGRIKQQIHFFVDTIVDTIVWGQKCLHQWKGEFLDWILKQCKICDGEGGNSKENSRHVKTMRSNISINICPIELKWVGKISKMWYDNEMSWIRITVRNWGDL